MNHLLDVARGAYVRLPAPARTKIGWALRFLPEDMKWGATYREWRKLLAEARSNPALIRERRHRARLAMVKGAHERSPYYRAMFDDVFGAGITSQRLLSDSNWHRIPILTSALVLEHGRAMCTLPIDELDIGSSGGTSGKPVKFFLDRNRSPIEYAFVHDAWARAGFRAGDPRVVFRSLDLGGGGHPAMQYEPALAELRCSVFHLSDDNMSRYSDEILARGIRFIHGYPSAIAIFAAFLLRSGRAPMTQIEGVFPSSERFDATQRELVSHAFGNPKIVPFYGLSEKVAFASVPADDLDVFEFEPLYGYTELVDEDGAPLTTVGASGRVISTGLLFPGMPFLRYDTGDRAELVAPPTADNRYRLTVRRIGPKHDTEYLLSRSNLLIAVKGIISNLQGTGYDIREYQFYQDKPGEAVVRIVPLSGMSADFTDYCNLLNRKMAGEMRVVVEIVASVATTLRGKRKLVDQRLDLSKAIETLEI